MADRPFWPVASPDRVRLGTPGTVAVALLLGASFWSALATLPEVGEGRIFLQAAVATAVVAVIGLRSIPVRWIARSYAVIGALLMVRVGALGAGAGLAAAGPVVAWVATTAAALALCPSPVGAVRPLPGTTPITVVHARADDPDAGPWPARIRAAAAAAVLVAAVALLLGPFAARFATPTPSGGGTGNQFDTGADNALTVQNRLDTTRRPRLSDRTVMTVRSDLESFWRTATFDRWDGSQWLATDGGAYRAIGPDGRVLTTEDDIGARSGTESTQEFRLAAGYANVLPIAPSAVAVDAVGLVYQRPDGSLVVPRGLGPGASYTVTSRQVPVDEAMLRAADGAVPDDIAQRYALPAPTTDRVRDAARSVAGNLPTAYAKVRALEDWMGARTTYSLDAPLAPVGVDVVDHFLFVSKQGWCEQIASSLVVMLRQVGVPARIATGFAPGEYDRSTGRWVVRERDAHAWAEVWFAGVGWVPFDPTAHVPLAGEQDAHHDSFPMAFVLVAIGLVVLAVLVLLAVPLVRWLRRRRRDRALVRDHRRAVAGRWDVEAERELERLGASVGRPRAPGQTVPSHAAEVADATGVRELVHAGHLVDREPVRHHDKRTVAIRCVVTALLAIP